MIKKIIFALIFTNIALLNTNAQSLTFDTTLKGKVRSVITNECLTFGDINVNDSSESCTSTLAQYNPFGKITEKTVHSRSYKTYSKEYYLYEDDNKTFSEYTLYDYYLSDLSGIPLDSMLLKKITLLYNDKWKCVEEMIENVVEKQMNMSSFYYDSDNQLVEYELKNLNDHSKSTIIKYTYNSNNQVVKESLYNPDSKQPKRWHTYSYNTDGSFVREQYEWPNFEKPVETIYNDQNHNIIKAIYNNGEGIVTETYTYTYDDRGNWIKQERYMQYGENEKILYSISSRHIKYWY